MCDISHSDIIDSQDVCGPKRMENSRRTGASSTGISMVGIPHLFSPIKGPNETTEEISTERRRGTFPLMKNASSLLSYAGYVRSSSVEHDQDL